MTRTHERLIHVIGAFLITAGLALWLTSTFRENMLFFITPTEFAQLPKEHSIKSGKRFRLGGLVLTGSIKKNGLDLIFTVIDEHSVTMIVQYHGIAPELFREKQGVIAEGTLKGEFFEAKRLLVKHDERYIPRK
ncbi:MAG: cytochrome c maturation protein CcmE [Pseudomonadota bacterium]